MLHAQWAPYRLIFKETAITSRDRMQVKDTYLVRLWDDDDPSDIRYGEVPLFKGLSPEDTPDFEKILADTCRRLETGWIFPLKSCSTADGTMSVLDDHFLPQASSIRFGLQTAICSQAGILYDTSWTRGEIPITINGLIWMGDKDTMIRRIRAKLDDGFRCIKIKIGGIGFDDEIDLLRLIRSSFSAADVELRLDANGSLWRTAPLLPSRLDVALQRLDRLAAFDIHSIEQPIPPGNLEAMARIIDRSPIPIAFDEELYGCPSHSRMIEIISLRPAYIVVKPSLCGGLFQTQSWIETARRFNVGWWITSALESNLGLDSLGQFSSRMMTDFDSDMPQGLGTGNLYTNNFTYTMQLRGPLLSRIADTRIQIPDLQWR